MAKKKSTTYKHQKSSYSELTRKIEKLTGKKVNKREEAGLRIEPDAVPDPEEVGFDDDTTDDPNENYPPPKRHPVFKAKWRQFIGSLSGRDGFKIGHLNQLELLCDLYVEYAALSKFIRTKGYTYSTISRFGTLVKPYPQVALMKTTMGQIHTYTKALGLNPKKDMGNESGGEGANWE